MHSGTNFVMHRRQEKSEELRKLRKHPTDEDDALQDIVNGEGFRLSE